SGFTATVSWGDGTPDSPASVVATEYPGQWAVLANHTFADEGTVTLSVQVRDPGAASALAFHTLTVADAALHLQSIAPPVVTAGMPFSGPVASFTDDNLSAPVTDFTATVSWGDGSPDSAASVSALGGGQFGVAAAHTYATPGTFTLTLSVLDEGGSSLTA